MWILLKPLLFPHRSIKMKLKAVLVVIRTSIEFFGRHPFVTGLLALLSIVGLLLSIAGYRSDRRESRDSTEQVAGVNDTVKQIFDKVQRLGRDWQVMDRAFYGVRVGGPIQPVYDLNFERILRKGSGNKKSIEWKTYNSNIFIVTFDGGQDRIRKIEIEWSGSVSGKDVGIADFRFGESTLQDIRGKFGSNGFSYAAKVMYFNDDGIVTLNAFELKETPAIIVVFKTLLSKSSKEFVDKLPAEDQVLGKIGNYFVLTGIIVADETYLDEEWGNRKIYDPNSNPIALE